MTTLRGRRSVGRRHSNSIRTASKNCLVTGLVVLGGCSFLDTVTTRTGAVDNRTQLRWQDGTLFLQRGELENYTCINDLPLQCESVGGKSLCRCPRR